MYACAYESHIACTSQEMVVQPHVIWRPCFLPYEDPVIQERNHLVINDFILPALHFLSCVGMQTSAQMRNKNVHAQTTHAHAHMRTHAYTHLICSQSAHAMLC